MNKYTILLITIIFLFTLLVRIYSEENNSNVEIIFIKMHSNPKFPVILIYLKETPSKSIDSLMFRYRRFELSSTDSTFPQSHKDDSLLVNIPLKDTTISRLIRIYGDSLGLKDGKYNISTFTRDTLGNWSDYSEQARGTCHYIRDRVPPKNIKSLQSLAQNNRTIELIWSLPSEMGVEYDGDSVRFFYDTVCSSLFDDPNFDINEIGIPYKQFNVKSKTDTIIDAGIQEKTVYYINAFVKDTSNNWSEGTISARDTVETLDETPPGNITGLAGKAISKELIILSWSPSVSNDAVSLMIRYNTDGSFPDSINNGSLIKKMSHSAVSDTLTDLREKTMHYLSFFVKDSSGNWSPFSDSATISIETLDETPPGNIKGLAGRAISKDSITLSWLPSVSNDADSIMIRYNTDGTFPGSVSDGSLMKIKSHSAVSDTLTGLHEKTMYYLSFFVKDSSGNWSSHSDSATISIETMDETPPDNFLAPRAKVKSIGSIELSWGTVSPDDVDTLLLIFGESRISGVEDTVKFSYTFLSPSTAQYLVENLNSNTIYYFALFIGDNVPNWSSPAYDSSRTLNDRPVCVISPVENEQSKDVTITYGLSDVEHDELSIKAYFSLDGYEWIKARISGDTSKIMPLQYVDMDRTIEWRSDIDLSDLYSDSVLFTIIPYDKQVGRGDTVQLTVDNSHGNTVEIKTPKGLQTGNIIFPYTVKDSTYDTLFFSSFFSIDSGTHWTATESVYPKAITPQEYNDSVKWDSDSDIGEKAYDNVQFIIVCSDGWEAGSHDTTSFFSVDNTPIIEFIDTPNVINDTVECAIRIISRKYDSLSLVKSSFSYNGNKKNITSLSRGSMLHRNQYDSINIVWPSKIDFTSNSSEMSLLFQFSVGNFIREIESPVFSLNNNEIPKITISEISSEQHGDVILTASIEDTDQDTIEIIVEFFDSQVNTWKPAKLEENNLLIAPLNYGEFSTIWKSASDIPNRFKENVFIRIFPFDQDTGNADTVSFVLTNLNVPVCEEIHIPDMGILSDKIQIIHILKDNDQSFLDLDLYYFLDSQWIKTENVHGNIKRISSENYIDTLIWYSSIEFPDTVIPELKIKIVPKDNITGQSELSHTFKLDNTSILPEITGDFNSDGMVDINDFYYVSRYWSMSAMGINHYDSIVELAPANGTPPFKIVLSDSVFDHNDLRVFTELCYWWFNNSPPEKRINQIQKNAIKRNNFQTISQKRSGKTSEIDLHFKIRDIHDLNFCRYRVFVNTPHVSLKKIYVRDKWDVDPEGTIQSLIVQDSVKADIGISRFAVKNKPFTGSTDIAEMRLVGKTNSTTKHKNSITVIYELFNSNHEIIESGCVELTIPELETDQSVAVENGISVFPNPSFSNIHEPLFTLIQNESTKQRFENNNSGFYFQIPAQNIERQNSFFISIKIFDALGNTVAENTELNIIPEMFHTFSNIRLYWNGCTTRGRKPGSGIYKAMIICRTDRYNKVYFTDVGVK